AITSPRTAPSPTPFLRTTHSADDLALGAVDELVTHPAGQSRDATYLVDRPLRDRVAAVKSAIRHTSSGAATTSTGRYVVF
ncbi:MAG: hypothetical protein J2P17_11520, partial [Mycobacterium sp.]|nr:hypothetical protein [Mycobacterium sp.]